MITKLDALELAISANLEHSVNVDGKSVPDVDKLIEAAKKIRNYINGETKNENV